VTEQLRKAFSDKGDSVARLKEPMPILSVSLTRDRTVSVPVYCFDSSKFISEEIHIV